MITVALFKITKPWNDVVSIDRTLDRENVVNIHRGFFSAIKKNEVICKKMYANGDIHIRQIKAVSEKQ